MKRSKRYLNAKKEAGTKKITSPEEAINLIKEISKDKACRFEESLEIAINLNLKAKHTVRDTFILPYQSLSDKESKRILVFAKGNKAEEALKAGANHVGDQDLIDKIKDGWIDFDVAIATPDIMRQVGKLGPILGRRGLMPNPKTGTVTMNIKGAIQEFKQGKVEFRADKTGIVHLKIGKVSMPTEELLANARTLYKEILKKKPVDLKGEYIKSIALSSTMGPGVKITHYSLN